MSLKTVNFKDFVNIISKNQNQKYPLKIIFKNEKELQSLKRICLCKNISFIDNIQDQIDDFKQIYVGKYKQDPSSYRYFLERIRCRDAKSYGDFIYLGWGEKCVVNLMGKDYVSDLLNFTNCNQKLFNSNLLDKKDLPVCVIDSTFNTLLELISIGFNQLNFIDVSKTLDSKQLDLSLRDIRSYGRSLKSERLQILFGLNPYLDLNLFSLDDIGLSTFMYKGRYVEMIVKGDACDTLVDGLKSTNLNIPVLDVSTSSNEKKLSILDL